MAVLGAEFIRPDFSAGAKITAAQQLRDKPFNDAIKQGNLWLSQRKAAREAKTQQEFDNKLALSRLSILSGNAKSTQQTNQLRANELNLKAEAAKQKQDRQLRVDATALKNLNAIHGVIERYQNDPNSVTDDEIWEAQGLAEAMDGSESENEGNAAALFLGKIGDSRSTQFIRKNINDAKVFAAKGNLYDSQKEADEASGGLWENVPLVTGQGSGAQFGVKIGTLSSAGLAKANSIINRAIRSGEGFDGVSAEDEAFINEAKQDPDIAERFNELADLEAKRVPQQILGEEDLFVIDDRLLKRDSSGTLTPLTSSESSKRTVDFSRDADAKNPDGTFKTVFSTVTPEGAVITWQRIGDENSSSFFSRGSGQLSGTALILQQARTRRAAIPQSIPADGIEPETSDVEADDETSASVSGDIFNF